MKEALEENRILHFNGKEATLIKNFPQENASLRSINFLLENFQGKGQFLDPCNHAEFLSLYSGDSQNIHTMPPLAVFRPQSIICISEFVQMCNELKIPITPRCGGTSLTGSCLAARGGIILLTGHFRSFSNYDPIKGIVTIEPGVTSRQINYAFSKDGWIFPLEMSSSGVAGIAGALSTNAKSYSSAHIGTIADKIISLTIVNGLGKTCEVSPNIICGSEGTLGIITSLTLKLERKQKSRELSLHCSWDYLLKHLDLFRSLNTVVSLEWCSESSACFSCRIQGDTWRLDAAYEDISELFSNNLDAVPTNAIPFHDIPHGFSQLSLSSSVPVRFLEKAMGDLQILSQQCEFTISIRTQILDGRIQFTLASSIDTKNFRISIENFLLDWVNYLDSVGGTILGSAGIGSLFSKYIPAYYSDNDIEVLRKLKKVFDPNNIFSPGNFFPVKGRCIEKKANRLHGN
jgi:glycolate oxidase